jgi:hypothetical protein
MKFDYLNAPGYTDGMALGISTPTGYGRKTKKHVMHPHHVMHGGVMHPHHAMHPYHPMHPHLMHPHLMEGGAKKRGRKPKHAVGMVHPLATYHPHHAMHGGAFNIGRSFKHLGHEISHGAKQVGHFVTPIAKKLAKQASSKYLPQAGKMLGAFAGESLATAVGQPELAPVLGSVGSQLGSRVGTTASQKLNAKIGSARYRKKTHPALNNRGEIVKQVMREHGMSLPQASAFVKAHGLYTPKHA